MISVDEYRVRRASNSAAARLARRVVDFIDKAIAFGVDGPYELSVAGWDHDAVMSVARDLAEAGWSVSVINDQKLLRNATAPALVFSCEVAA